MIIVLDVEKVYVSDRSKQFGHDVEAAFAISDLDVPQSRGLALTFSCLGFDLFREKELRPGIQVIQQFTDHFTSRNTKLSVRRLLICFYVFVDISADARPAVKIADERRKIEYIQQVSRQIARYNRIGQLGSGRQGVCHRNERSDKLGIGKFRIAVLILQNECRDF